MKRIYLRQARQRAKLTQVQLAAMSGVDQRVISKLETSISNPNLDTALKLAKALRLDPRALQFGPQKSSPQSAPTATPTTSTPAVPA